MLFPSSNLHVTGLYAGIFGIWIVILAVSVARLRNRFQVGLGSGGVKELTQAIRIHANNCEYLPLALILMGLAELNTGHIELVKVSGAVLLFSRLLHAWGISRSMGISLGRAAGIVGTWGVIVVLAIFNIWAYR